jgi:hypothetical protein
MSCSFIPCVTLTVKLFIPEEDGHAGFCVTNFSIYFYHRSAQYVVAEERKTFHLPIVVCSPLLGCDRETNKIPTAMSPAQQ